MRLVILILLLSLPGAIAQPVPPAVDGSQLMVDSQPEPPQTFLRRAEWRAVAGVEGYWVGLWNPATNFDCLVANTNGIPTTNTLVPVVRGTNYYAVKSRTASGLYSVPTQTNWFIWTEDRVKLKVTPEGWYALTNSTGLPNTNTAAQFHPLAVASVIATTNGKGLP
jgi:hypothetical protein